MKIHRGRIAQYRHDQLLREYLKQNLTEIIQQKELIIDGKVKTPIVTLDLPTLKFGEESPFLAQGAGSGGGAGGGTGQIQGRGGLVGATITGRNCTSSWISTSSSSWLRRCSSRNFASRHFRSPPAAGRWRARISRSSMISTGSG